MTPAQKRLLQNSQYRYTAHLNEIDVDNEIINKIKEEHLLVVNMIINHMLKEKTIHRSNELIAFLQRMTNVMFLLFSSDSASTTTVSSIKNSFVKSEDETSSSESEDIEENCSIEQALNELISLDI